MVIAIVRPGRDTHARTTMRARVLLVAGGAFVTGCASSAGSDISSRDMLDASPPVEVSDASTPNAPDASNAATPPANADAGTLGCTTDVDCNHGKTGTGEVCATDGAQSGNCISACHVASDCPAGEICDQTTSPHWSCVAPPKSTPDAGATNGCPVLAYPSGVHLQTFTDSTTTATYADHLESGQTAPTCFIDTDRLVDPVAGTTYDLSVAVSTHFTLDELVGTEISQGYGHFVLMAPKAVTSLEGFRVALNVAVDVISGFRSPKHQEDVCNGLCGDPLGCAGTCANSSRHLWGDAFDLPLDFYTKPDEDLACTEGFTFAYLESGTHLHVDQNPAYATCVEE